MERRLRDDVAAIEAADWSISDERALDEAQKVLASETERVRSAEGKATTYLAVLAALVPVIITLQAANWEKKAGPAPDGARLLVLALATIYVAAAGYHAFRTLQVAGFQRVGEAEIAAAWRSPQPLRRLTRGTLHAARRSRATVNAKVTRIRVTHEHLLRAFGVFVVLLLLDPLFYGLGYRSSTTADAVRIGTGATGPTQAADRRPRNDAAGGVEVPQAGGTVEAGRRRDSIAPRRLPARDADVDDPTDPNDAPAGDGTPPGRHRR